MDVLKHTKKLSMNDVRMFFENRSKYQVTNARLTLLEERLFITLKEPCQNVSQYSRNVAFLQ